MILRKYSEPLGMTSIRNLAFWRLAKTRTLMGGLPWTPIWGWPCTDGPLDAPDEMPAGSHRTTGCSIDTYIEPTFFSRDPECVDD